MYNFVSRYVGSKFKQRSEGLSPEAKVRLAAERVSHLSDACVYCDRGRSDLTVIFFSAVAARLCCVLCSLGPVPSRQGSDPAKVVVGEGRGRRAGEVPSFGQAIARWLFPWFCVVLPVERWVEVGAGVLA